MVWSVAGRNVSLPQNGFVAELAFCARESGRIIPAIAPSIKKRHSLTTSPLRRTVISIFSDDARSPTIRKPGKFPPK